MDPEEMQSYTLKYAVPTVDTTCATARLNALERAVLYGDDVPACQSSRRRRRRRELARRGKCRMMGTMMMRVVVMNEGTLYYVGTAGRSDTAHRQRPWAARCPATAPQRRDAWQRGVLGGQQAGGVPDPRVLGVVPCHCGSPGGERGQRSASTAQPRAAKHSAEGKRASRALSGQRRTSARPSPKVAPPSDAAASGRPPAGTAARRDQALPSQPPLDRDHGQPEGDTKSRKHSAEAFCFYRDRELVLVL